MWPTASLPDNQNIHFWADDTITVKKSATIPGCTIIICYNHSLIIVREAKSSLYHKIHKSVYF